MAVSEVRDRDLTLLLDRLSGVISLDRDLPMNVFVGDEFLYWFFERPLLCYVDFLRA